MHMHVTFARSYSAREWATRDPTLLTLRVMIAQVLSPGGSNVKEDANFFVQIETVAPIPPFAGFLAEPLDCEGFYSPGQKIQAKFKVRLKGGRERP
jgi:hypothetical protein